ncbi:MAG: hypothetical protein LBI64_05670 [Coriobacteriales bacterium]|nr:hypothetical protein [Coriobacteriales bacterium]
MSDAQTPSQDSRKGHARSLELFPVRLLGFGLFIAWGSLVVSLEKNLGVASLSSPVSRLLIISALCAACYIAIAWFVHATGRSFWSRKVVLACCILGAFFPLLEEFAAYASLFAIDVCAIISYSLVTVGLFLMWNVQIAAHHPRTAWTAYAGSMTLAACVYFLVNVLGDIALLISLLVLPMLSGILLIMSTRLPRDSDDVVEEKVDWKVPWRPVLLILAFSFAFGLVMHYEGNAGVPSELGRLVASCIILFCVMALFSHFDENIIAKASSLFVVAALLLCGIEGFDDFFGMGKLLVSIGYYALMLYVYFALSTICFRYKARVEWLFGIIQAMYFLMFAPSGLFGNWLKVASAHLEFPLVDSTVCATAILVMSLSLLLLTKSTFNDTWGIKALKKVSNDAPQACRSNNFQWGGGGTSKTEFIIAR